MIRVKCLSCLEIVSVEGGEATISPDLLRIVCPEEKKGAIGSRIGGTRAAPAEPSLELPEPARGSFPDASRLAPDPPERRGTMPDKPGRIGGKEPT